MKITWRHGDRSIEFEHQPMEPEKFAALSRLALVTIGGGMLLGAIALVCTLGGGRTGAGGSV